MAKIPSAGKDILKVKPNMLIVECKNGTIASEVFGHYPKCSKKTHHKIQ